MQGENPNFVQNVLAAGIGVALTQDVAAFKDELKKLRKANRMSQEKLARAAGTSKQTISNLELGTHQPSNETLHKLAMVFKMSIEEMSALAPEAAEGEGKNSEIVAEFMRVAPELAREDLLKIITTLQDVSKKMHDHRRANQTAASHSPAH